MTTLLASFQDKLCTHWANLIKVVIPEQPRDVTGKSTYVLQHQNLSGSGADS